MKSGLVDGQKVVSGILNGMRVLGLKGFTHLPNREQSAYWNKSHN